MSHVLEHCLDPAKALGNVHDLLKPGGKFFCEVPNCAARGRKRRGYAWAMMDIPRHLHFFWEESLRAFCEQASLHVEHVTFGHYQRQFSSDWIETEAMLWGQGRLPGHCPEPMSPRNSRFNAWKLLFETALASREHRYDCVGIIATRR